MYFFGKHVFGFLCFFSMLTGNLRGETPFLHCCMSCLCFRCDAAKRVPGPTFFVTVCCVCDYVAYGRAFVTRSFDFSFQKLRFGPRDTLRCTIVSSRLLAMVVRLFFNGQCLVSGKPYPPHTRPLSVPRAHLLFPQEAALAAMSGRVPSNQFLQQDKQLT